MSDTITGLHHLTAFSGDAQRNIDFYAGILGLRLVKKTVNFDDPSSYHLYYGDQTGAPGTLVTFFYWPGFAVHKGPSVGKATSIVFSVPQGSLDFWNDRLQSHKVCVVKCTRFDEDVLMFDDPDGIPVELVAVANDLRKGWVGAGISSQYALRGLHTFELSPLDLEPTEKILTSEMGFRLVKREGVRARFEVGEGGSGHYADVLKTSAPRGFGGIGPIHHVAWCVADDGVQLEYQKALRKVGYQVSPVRDRDYFHSIYYLEGGGILFEIATEGPGFLVDEPEESLGLALKLPKMYESDRVRIEEMLPPLLPPHFK